MKIKFVGSKPIITQTGITFNNNKDDKFVYLNISVQLLKAFKVESITHKVYTYDTKNKRLNNDEIYDSILHYCPDVKEVIEAHQQHAQTEVDNDIDRAKNTMLLGEDERMTLVKNITIMRDYVIQRAVNKAVYYRVINEIASELKKEKIDYVIAPMFQNFAHIFHSIQSVFQEQSAAIDTAIEIYEEEGKLLIKLKIKTL